MGLIACPDCGKDVSDRAAACNGCGAPIEADDTVAKPGTTVSYSQQEVSVMLSRKKRTNHVLHFLLSIVTIGFWVVVWILVALSNSMENARIDRKIAKGKQIK